MSYWRGMIIQGTEIELDLATPEFIKTFKDFKEAAKKSMDIMDSIRAK